MNRTEESKQNLAKSNATKNLRINQILQGQERTKIEEKMSDQRETKL